MYDAPKIHVDIVRYYRIGGAPAVLIIRWQSFRYGIQGLLHRLF